MSLLLIGQSRGRPGPPAWAPNVPSGFITLADNSLDGAYASGSIIDGWQMSGSGNVIQNGVPVPLYQRIADSSGGNGAYVGRLNYPEGSLGGLVQPNPPSWVGSGGSGSASFINYTLPQGSIREIYAVIRLRFSPAYVVHTTGYTEKLWYPTFSAGLTGQSPVIQLGGSATGEPPFGISTWWYNDSGTPFAKPSTAQLFRGTWHNVEVHQRINSYNPAAGVTNASADGFSRIWVDGVLVEDFQNWRGAMMTTQQTFFQYPRFASTRGGGDSTVPVPSGGMWRDYDRMMLAYKVEA